MSVTGKQKLPLVNNNCKIYIYFKCHVNNTILEGVLFWTALQRQGCELTGADCGGCTWSQMRSHFFSLSYCRRRRALSGGRFIEFWKTRERFCIRTHRKSCIPLCIRGNELAETSLCSFSLGHSGFLSDTRNPAAYDLTSCTDFLYPVWNHISLQSSSKSLLDDWIWFQTKILHFKLYFYIFWRELPLQNSQLQLWVIAGVLLLGSC